MRARGRIPGRSRQALGLVLALTSLLAGLGCEDPFRPESLVDRLRILGVRSDPPAVGLDDRASLEALVADPAGAGRAVTCSWAVCLLEISDFATDIPCPGPDAYALAGSGPTTELSMPDLVAWALERGFPLEPGRLPGKPGELESFPLIIGLRVDAGDESVRAIKRIELRLVEQDEPSTNPRLAGLEAEGQPIGSEPLVVSAGAGSVLLRPLADEDSRDWYTPPGSDEVQLEDFLFSWFSTTGEFEERWTVLDVSSAGSDLSENQFLLPAGEIGLGEQRLWVVVRDGRFGVDWLAFDLRVEP
jgi:hypothetical protein